MNKHYCVITKTGDAEFRALANLPSRTISKILPIIELTRGRKLTAKTEKKEVSYPYNRRIDRVKEIFHDQDIAIDVTSNPSLSSPEIDLLFDYSEGYSQWIDLLMDLNTNGGFNSIIPSVLLNYDDEKFDFNLKKEIKQLNNLFHSIMYRYVIDSEYAMDDLRLISSCFPYEKELIVILDCEYVPTSSIHSTAKVCVERIKIIKNILGNRNYKIILASTTFPNNVTETNDDASDTIYIREIDLYNLVKEKNADIIYADYGSINPKRNDQIVMAHGWVPRIDVALSNCIYYYRLRRPKGSTAYSSTYEIVANQVVHDSRFPYSQVDLWGISQIINCSIGSIPSASPSFWISVRMNTFISQQVKRLSL
jgi:hypothetical protein